MAILTDVQGKILMCQKYEKKAKQTRAGGRILVPKWMMKMKVVFILLVCSLVQVQAAVSGSPIESFNRAEKRDIGEGFSGIGKANGL